MTDNQDHQKPDAPPSYAAATGSSTNSTKSNFLEVPGARNGIPAARRRSMEDEQRPLPPGWIRQFDANEQHQFFVDTKATPPRSIWHHPHDDEQFLKSLTSEERERIQEDERHLQEKGPIEDHTDEESTPTKTSGSIGSADLPPRPSVDQGKDKKGPFARRLKDKLTGTTHEERTKIRQEQAQAEQEYYEAHMRLRQAMQRAQMTGQPQFLAKDRDGRDVYIEPPNGPGSAYGGYGQGYGYNPYSSGPYTNPNARFIRPPGPYGRPYGRGYGGGYGLPIAGGLLGGMMLGGLLF